MGTKSSKTEEENIKEKEIKLQPQFFGTNYDESFSTTQNTQTEEKTIKNTNNEISSKKYPFKFEYKSNGNSVLLAGSFLDNWDRKETLKFNNESKSYEITLNIPRGLNQFKFIVDDKWLCSKYYKVIKDKSNNDNNEIDTNATSEASTMNSLINSNILDMKKKKKKSGKGNNDYNCLIPTKSAVNAEAPIIPLYFKSYLNLDFNSNQLDETKFKDKLMDSSEEKSKEKTKENENEEVLILNKTKDLLETNTFKSIMTIPHEKLSHLFFYCDNDNKYIRNAVTQRNKHKFLTVVYFSPKN